MSNMSDDNLKLIYCEVFEAGYKEGDCSYNGVYIATNNKIYFSINSHVLTFGVRIYETDPSTKKTEIFWDAAKELPDLHEGHVEQGKIHSPLSEVNGELICATHTGWYVKDHTISGTNMVLKPYMGGYVLAIDLETAKTRIISKPFQNYPITFSFKGGPLTMLGEAIITSIFDRAKNLYYAISFPKARLAKIDIVTGQTTIYSSRQAKAETVPQFLDTEQKNPNPNYEWILRALALDDEGNVFGCNGKGEIWKYDPIKDDIILMKARIEDAIGHENYKALSYQNQWRTILWDNIDKVFYGIQWGNSWLFKYDPRKDKIEPIIKWIPEVEFNYNNKAMMGFLGFTMGPNHVLYGFRHVPAQEGTNDLSVHLLTYDLNNKRFIDHGKVMTEDSYTILYAESCAIAENGDAYTVAWVEAREEEREESEQRRKKGVFSDVTQPYVMKLIRIPSNRIHLDSKE